MDCSDGGFDPPVFLLCVMKPPVTQEIILSVNTQHQDKIRVLSSLLSHQHQHQQHAFSFFSLTGGRWGWVEHKRSVCIDNVSQGHVKKMLS